MEKTSLTRKILLISAALLVAAGIILVSVFAGRSNGGEDIIKIGVVIYRGDDTFIGNMMNSLREFTEDLELSTGKRINLSILDSQNSQSVQNDQVERLISLNYDVICVNLVDRTSAAYVIESAMDADVPVVFFNREPVQEDLQKWDKLYYVGTDAQENGYLEGKIIVDAYKSSPEKFDKNGDGILQYIMIEGEARHQDAVLRTEGSVQTLRDAGIQVEKLDGGIASWERSQAAALGEEYFTKYGNAIELVISNNDDMALGVIDALDRLGIDFKNIVGIDGTPQGVEAVRNGQMLGTVVIDLNAQAKMILDIAFALAEEKDVDKVMTVPEDKCIRAQCYAVTAESLERQN